MKKLYQLKLDGKFWMLKHCIVPCWSNQGDFFTEEELTDLIHKFKYQRKLWPEGTTVVEYTVDDTKTKETSFASDLFATLDKELTYEKLKGSSY